MSRDLDIESTALTPAERLPPDVVLLKMENEQIFAIARTTPRDPFKIVAQLQQLIDAYPAAADDAIYSKPVGTIMKITCKCGVSYEAGIKWVNRKPVSQHEPCPNCGEWAPVRQQPKKKFAEGLSIRAAESIRSIYGYTRLATKTELLPDGTAKLSGILVDYAAGNITSDERPVSPNYKTRDGQMARVPEDRFLNLVLKAEKAKLRRDIILDNTPNIVKVMFTDACEKKLIELVKPEIVEQKILPAFAQYGLTPEHLEQIVGRSRKLGWGDEERLELRKILTALRNDETTVHELLAGLDDEGRNQPATSATGATLGDLARKQPTPPAPEQEPPEPPTAEAIEPSWLDQIRDALQGLDAIDAVAGLVTSIDADANRTAEEKRAGFELCKARHNLLMARAQPAKSGKRVQREFHP